MTNATRVISPGRHSSLFRKKNIGTPYFLLELDPNLFSFRNAGTSGPPRPPPNAARGWTPARIRTRPRRRRSRKWPGGLVPVEYMRSCFLRYLRKFCYPFDIMSPQLLFPGLSYPLQVCQSGVAVAILAHEARPLWSLGRNTQA